MLEHHGHVLEYVGTIDRSNRTPDTTEFQDNETKSPLSFGAGEALAPDESAATSALKNGNYTAGRRVGVSQRQYLCFVFAKLEYLGRIASDSDDGECPGEPRTFANRSSSRSAVVRHSSRPLSKFRWRIAERLARLARDSRRGRRRVVVRSRGSHFMLPEHVSTGTLSRVSATLKTPTDLRPRVFFVTLNRESRVHLCRALADSGRRTVL